MRNTDTQGAGQQLVEHQPFAAAQLLPTGNDCCAAYRLVLVGHGQQVLFDPFGEGPVGSRLRRIIQQQGERFGQVTDLRIAVFDQPRWQTRLFGNPGAQFAACRDLPARAADLAATEQ
ncbi:hypothetical protein G6F65_012418 [Rhizopus arrhizus]|nr:hypothetical protein G6F65_012418 [Rhizopus arrhizus]